MSLRWEKVREQEPTNEDSYNAIAAALFQVKNYEKCEEVLTAGLKLHPNNLNLLYNLGNLYLKTNKPDLSLHYFQLTMDIDPDYMNVRKLVETKFKKT